MIPNRMILNHRHKRDGPVPACAPVPAALRLRRTLFGQLDQDVIGGHDTRAGWPAIANAAACGRGGVALRRWAAQDAARFRTLLDDPEVWRHMTQPYPDPVTAGMAAALIDLSINSDHHVVRAITARGEPVGQVRMEFLEPGLGEVSYWLGRAAWGRGLASAALALFLADAPGLLPRPMRVIARIRPDNPASMRVARANGFRHEGPDPADPGWILFARAL